MVSGCCFVVDVQKFISINKLDENVFLYNEENILASKIARTNYKVIAISEAFVIHDHGSSTGKNNVFVDQKYIESTLYYFKKYRLKNSIYIWTLRLALLLKMRIKSLFKKYKDFSKADFNTFKKQTKLLIKKLNGGFSNENN